MLSLNYFNFETVFFKRYYFRFQTECVFLNHEK